jgi:hypothetical protein
MKAITANRLTDGRVIYRTLEGQWSIDITHAQHMNDNEAEAILPLAETEYAVAVGPYLIDIEAHGPGGQKWRREGIRLGGPSTGSTRVLAVAQEIGAA